MGDATGLANGLRRIFPPAALIECAWHSIRYKAALVEKVAGRFIP